MLGYALLAYTLISAAYVINGVAAPGDILFEEQFSNNGDFNGDWDASGAGDASVDNSTFNSLPNALALSESTVTVTSKDNRIDTSGIDGADVSVWIRRGSDTFSENPDNNEDLTVEYLDSANQWINLATYPGSGTPGETITPTFTLPSAGLHSGFRLRFTLEQGSGNNFDFWHIDDVQVIETGPIAVPAPIAEYRLDEASWSGSANEVVDESGNGLHGVAVNLGGLPTTDDSNPAITGNPGTCGYGEFDGTSDGYVQINDPGVNSILDLPNNFSVAVWIYPTAFPNSGLATIVSKDENFEFHLTTAGRVNWWWGGGSRTMTSTSSVTLNTWNHVTITYESGSQFIYIDGVESGTNNSTAAVTVNNDDVFIGTDLNFHSRRFTGLIDEVKIYDVTLSGPQVEAVRDQTHACSSSLVNHYAVQHSGSGVTCEAENITIVAHDASDAAVDANTATITVSATSSTPGWSANDTTWSLVSGSGSFSSSTPGMAEYQFGSTETQVILNLANTSEATIDIDVADGLAITDDDGSAEDPTLSFFNAAFRFYNDANGDGDADGTDPIATPLTSGTLSNPLILAAIETNLDTGACQARLLGSTSVELAYECVNPITCIRNQDMEINGTAIEENDLFSVSDFTDVALTFDADGEAPFSIEYFDVGNVRLHAQLSLSAGGGQPATTIIGSSATTTVKPADIVITAIETLGNIANPGGTATGDGFVAAGAAFAVTAEVRNADGGITPNYGREVSAEGLILNAESLVMPVGGNLAGLNAAGSFSPTATLGRFQNTSVNWPEAGTITLNTRIADADYLGEGDVTTSTSGNVGRFFPNSFNLDGATLAQGCAPGGFTYMSDQAFIHRPLNLSYTITAEDVTGLITLTNYDEALGYPVGGFNATAEDGNSGTSLNTRAFVRAETWVAGEYSVVGDNNGGFARALTGVNETVDGPFTDLQLGLIVDGSDPDAVNFTDADLTLRPDQSNDCVADLDCTAAALGATITARFGRLAGANAHGPETASLAVFLQSQYWNGTEFVTSNTDTCTIFSASDIDFAGNSLGTDGNRNVTVGAGTSTGTFTDLDPALEMTLVNGDAGLVFSAPGAGNTGRFAVDIDMSNYPWLRDDWNLDGNYANDTALPSLDINFGRYRGHDRIIFWQEVF